MALVIVVSTMLRPGCRIMPGPALPYVYGSGAANAAVLNQVFFPGSKLPWSITGFPTTFTLWVRLVKQLQVFTMFPNDEGAPLWKVTIAPSVHPPATLPNNPEFRSFFPGPHGRS